MRFFSVIPQGQGSSSPKSLVIFPLGSIRILSWVHRVILREGKGTPLQVIFQTQGSNPSLRHLLPWQAESVPLCHWGSLVAVQAADCRWLRPPPSTAPVCHAPRPPHSYMRQGDCENEILAMGPERRGTGF